jgi:hypothetical protein
MPARVIENSVTATEKDLKVREDELWRRRNESE